MAAVNDEAIDLLEEALAGVGDGDAALRAELLSTLARELYWTPGSRARREALAAEAVAMARDAADDRLLGWVLVNTTLATMGPDNPAARVAASEEAIALAERLGDRQLLVTAVFYLAVAALELGDTKRFESMWQRGAALAAELKDPVLTETVRYAEATIADADGRLAEGDATRIEAFLLGQESRDRNVVIQFLVGTVTSLRRQGRAAEGLGQAATSIALYPLAAATIHALVAAACVEMGDFERAGQELAAVDLADPSLACGDVTWLTTVGALGLAAAGLGDLDRAARLYDALTPYAGQFACVGHLSVLGAVDEYLGVLATALGRHDEAVAHLRAGLTAHERTGWRALIVEAQARLAGALLARGHPSDREEGVQLARAAVANADDFGMRAVARYARQVLGTAAGEDHAEGAPVSLAERGRSRLTHGARSLVGRFSRDHGDDDLVRRFGGQLAQRALFSAMAKSFQPSTAFGFEGAIQFDVAVPADGDPLPPDWWTIEVRGRKATCHRGRHADPSATIHTSLPALVRLLSGELHPMRAVIEGKVRVDGDVLVAARIQDMFGGLEVSSL
jgi:tetratricopeptide (TPR) repeat protein